MASTPKSKVVSDKVSKLAREGYKQKQAVAIAMNMDREGKLAPKGGHKKEQS